MKYEILNHTADFAVKFYGNSYQDIAESILSFFKKEIFVCSCESNDIFFSEKVFQDNFSYVIVAILNGIIFNLEMGNGIKELIIESQKNSLFKCKFNFCKCDRIDIFCELKAATLHNIRETNHDFPHKGITVLFDI